MDSSLLNLLTYFLEKAQRVSKRARVETASRRFKFTETNRGEDPLKLL